MIGRALVFIYKRSEASWTGRSLNSYNHTETKSANIFGCKGEGAGGEKEVYLNLATALAGIPKSAGGLVKVKASVHRRQRRKWLDQASILLKLGTRGTQLVTEGGWEILRMR